ncbi:hypothetical protein FQR65_LT17237 [Abscondita terminalis]|nr:hypothetical protein FQR65_LT17237 [Abscondita terminalis]
MATETEERRHIRQVGQVAPCARTGAETVVADGDAQPGDEAASCPDEAEKAQRATTRRWPPAPTGGTPLRDTRPNRAGALPSRARLYSMRVAAYIPELPADSTEVSTTAFMTEAAANRPARSRDQREAADADVGDFGAQQLRIV